MKVVILAGGKGTRITEESQYRPKPMVTICGKPILWHIMKIYSFYGYHDFIICCGYKGRMIKDYFIDFYMHQSGIIKDFSSDKLTICNHVTEPWKVTLVNTGLNTNTAARVKKIEKYTQGKPFMLTYGDGVANVNIEELLRFHQGHGKVATITVTKPVGRFGIINMKKDYTIDSFKEKSRDDQSYVNAGFAVFDPQVFDYLGDGSQMLEQGPYEKLAEAGQMKAFCHDGFWSPMDTMRDRNYLEYLWESGEPPWKVWE